MPSYVAFLRAINLGAKRKFPPAAIRAAAQAAGCSGIETYLNTGNVLVQSPLRSRARLEAVLEAAFLADRGFEVATITFRLADLVAIAEEAEALAHPGQHYVSLLKDEPTSAAVAALEAVSTPAETARVAAVAGRRAVHLMLGADYHSARITNAVVERHVGTATNRNLTVIRAVATAWGRVSGVGG